MGLRVRAYESARRVPIVRLRALQTAIDGLLNYKVMPGDEKPILVRMADNSGQKRQRAYRLLEACCRMLHLVCCMLCAA